MVREPFSIRFSVEAGLPFKYVKQRARVASERSLPALEKQGWVLIGPLYLHGPLYHIEPTTLGEFKMQGANEAKDDWALVGWFKHKALRAEILKRSE